jgi:hypothetical protein
VSLDGWMLRSPSWRELARMEAEAEWEAAIDEAIEHIHAAQEIARRRLWKRALALLEQAEEAIPEE